jgi:soluble lytic murein transglycosylase-like protein
VLLLALHVQRIDRLLARRPRLSARTLRRLPPRARAEAADSAGALRSLFRLTTLPTEARFRVGPPRPPDVLRGYYRTAQRRFGVSWQVLAAINLIETNFGRLRNVSSAGAVGPMQFLPSTWRSVGLGGDVHDPHDAILGAANYLHLSGAPGSYRRAVYAYNPSGLYVDAVLRFAHRIRRDRRAFYAYWSWQSFRRSAHGDVQLTGPGAR